MPKESSRINGRSWKKHLAASFGAVAAAYAATIATPYAASTSSTEIGTGISTISSPTSIPQIDTSLEHVLPNGVTVYGEDVASLTALVDDYQDVFVDVGTIVDIPENE